MSAGWVASVRVATVSNGTLATAFANGQTVDGVTLATGDRILIKDQTTPSQNGIYTVASGTPTRATDFDTGAEIVAAGVFVEAGTLNKYSAWVCTSPKSTVIGTNDITFAAFTNPIELSVAASNAPANAVREAQFRCSGVNDEQTLMIAINIASVGGGGIVRLSSGDFKIDTGGVLQLYSGSVGLVGDTHGGTTLVFKSGVTGACLTVAGTDSDNRTTGNRVSDIHFKGDYSSSQTGLQVTYGSFLSFERLLFDGFRRYGICLTGVWDSFMQQCIVRDSGSTGTAGGTITPALMIESVYLGVSSLDANCNNLTFIWCDFESNDERDVELKPASPEQLNAIRFIACKFENTSLMNGSTVDVNARIVVDNVDNIDFSGCFFFTGTLAGGAVRARAVILASGGTSGLVIRGCFYNTGTSGSAAIKAFCELADVTSAALTSNTFIYGAATQQPSTSAFLYSGSTSQVYRAGNVIASTVGSSPLESGSIAKKFSNSGTAIFGAGTTAVAVNHGLHAQPDPGDINVTPATTWGNTVRWWVSGIGATQFTINVNPAPAGSGMSFGWGAKVPSLDG